jgi:hypothetical protein
MSIKISELPSASALTGAEEIPLVQGGTTKKALASSFLLSGNATSLVQGDTLYASASNTLSALPKNTNASRYLSNTGASNNPAWAQIDLSNGVTGDLPFANLTQLAGLSVLGVTGGSTADVAAITAGTDNQVLRRSGVSLAFGAVNLASANAVTGTLPVTSGGTGLTAAAQGDLLYGSAANTLARLPKDTNATRYLANTGGEATSTTTVSITAGQSGSVTGYSQSVPVTFLPIGSTTGSLGTLGGAQALTLYEVLSAVDGSNIVISIQGASEAPADDVFTQVRFTDRLGTPHTLLAADATISGFSADGQPLSNGTSWEWPGVVAQAFTSGQSYDIHFDVTVPTNNPEWNQVNLANGVTGNLSVDHLDGGDNADSTTFWRGDGSWASLGGGNVFVAAATVNPDGSTFQAVNVDGTSRLGAGEYQIDFDPGFFADTPVVVTCLGFGPNEDWSVSVDDQPDADTVIVVVFEAGVPTDGSFRLIAVGTESN